MQYSELPSPCYVVDEALVEQNLKVLKGVMDRTGVKILLAQKAFSMYAIYPLIGEYLSGATASGLYEARLGYEKLQIPLSMKGKICENHVYSPAFRCEEFDEILSYVDHIVFNSFSQVDKFAKKALSCGKATGLRINPECSTQKGPAIYDPCAPNSRLGVDLHTFKKEYAHRMHLLNGIHFHTLCEQDADDLERTLDVVEEKFGEWLTNFKWINFGGGQLITKPGYDMKRLESCIYRMQKKYGLTVYLEPGEAVALNAGHLISTVLEIQNGDRNIAILDTSAACHMPDVLEMPYRPRVQNSGKDGERPYVYRLAGSTCLAGDVIGDYSFGQPLKEGDRVIFEDMAIYTMVKNNTFNGIPLPAIVLKEKNEKYKILKTFTYQDFESRL